MSSGHEGLRLNMSLSSDITSYFAAGDCFTQKSCRALRTAGKARGKRTAENSLGWRWAGVNAGARPSLPRPVSVLLKFLIQLTTLALCHFHVTVVNKSLFVSVLPPCTLNSRHCAADRTEGFGWRVRLALWKSSTKYHKVQSYTCDLFLQTKSSTGFWLLPHKHWAPPPSSSSFTSWTFSSCTTDRKQSISYKMWWSVH